MSMRFSRAHAVRALTSSNNNVELAIEWALTNTPDDSSVPDTTSANQQQDKSQYRDGSGKYRLMAFISHIGNQPSSGHYVAHILKDGRWVIFNDEHVALSENPPKDLAYLYFYQRVNA